MAARPFVEPDRSEYPDGDEGDEMYHQAMSSFDMELERRIDNAREARFDRREAEENRR